MLLKQHFSNFTVKCCNENNTTLNYVVSLIIKNKNREESLKGWFTKEQDCWWHFSIPDSCLCFHAARSHCVSGTWERERDRLWVGKLFQMRQCKANQKNCKRILTMSRGVFQRHPDLCTDPHLPNTWKTQKKHCTFPFSCQRLVTFFCSSSISECKVNFFIKWLI